MSAQGEEGAEKMSVQAVSPSSMSADEVNTFNKANEESMADPSTLQENHGEEFVKTNIIRFCAFVVAKPKLSFGKYSVTVFAKE